MCYPGIHECTRDDGTNREITEEGSRLAENNLVDLRKWMKMKVEVGVMEDVRKKLTRNRSSMG